MGATTVTRGMKRSWRHRLVVFALLGGGSVFSGCEAAFHDAIVDGTKGFVFSLFDVSRYADAVDESGI